MKSAKATIVANEGWNGGETVQDLALQSMLEWEPDLGGSILRRPFITAFAAVALGASLLTSNGSAGAATAHTTADPMPAGALRPVPDLSTTYASSYQDWEWSTPDPVDLYADNAGDLHVVTYNASGPSLSVTTYDPATLGTVGDPLTISLSGWPDWGDFYAAPDGNFYVLVGRDNLNQDDSMQVVAVRKYDAKWNLLGTAYVDGDATQGTIKGIYKPFRSAAHMMLTGKRLVVHMSRQIYAEAGSDIHHEVNLTFEVNVDTMTATTFDELGDVSYASHSFQELVAMNGTNLVMIDHGDYDPRGVGLGVMANYPTQRTVATYNLFAFNGGDTTDTWASVTSLISGPKGIVVLGNSVPQPDAPNGPAGSYAEQRNIFAISADPATGAHTVNWLTDFAADGTTGALEPRSIQVGNDRYAVLFPVRHGNSYDLEYRLIDSSAKVLASASIPGLFTSTICDPIVVGHTIFWVGDDPIPYAEGSTTPGYLYGLDITDPSAPVPASSNQTITPTPGKFIRTTKPKLYAYYAGAKAFLDVGKWAPTPATYRYTWYRNGQVIAGATKEGYRTSATDAGARLAARVTITKPGYQTTSYKSPAITLHSR